MRRGVGCGEIKRSRPARALLPRRHRESGTRSRDEKRRAIRRSPPPAPPSTLSDRAGAPTTTLPAARGRAEASRRRRADSPRDGCRSPRPRRRWSCAAAAGSSKCQAQTSLQREAAHVLRDVELRDVARRRDPVVRGEIRAAVHRRHHRLEALALEVVLEAPVADEPAPARLRADLARDAPRGRAIDVRLLRVRRRQQPAEREGEREPDAHGAPRGTQRWRRERAAAARAAPPAARPPRSRASSRRDEKSSSPASQSSRKRSCAEAAKRAGSKKRDHSQKAPAKAKAPSTASSTPERRAPRRLARRQHPGDRRRAEQQAQHDAPRAAFALRQRPRRAPDREEQRGAVVDRHRSHLVPDLPGLEAAADHDVGRAEEVHEPVTRSACRLPRRPRRAAGAPARRAGPRRGAGRAARPPRRAGARSRSPRTW